MRPELMPAVELVVVPAYHVLAIEPADHDPVLLPAVVVVVAVAVVAVAVVAHVPSAHLPPAHLPPAHVPPAHVPLTRPAGVVDSVAGAVALVAELVSVELESVGQLEPALVA